MDYEIIFIYSCCHDFLKHLGIKEDDQSKMNSAEIMTVAFSQIVQLFP